jgi:N-acetylmannosamine-6-phosphate 2-epimerase / N-acetylmannosamine kinase
MTRSMTLAIDLGGTKLLVALVDGGKVVDRVEAATDREAGPEAWLAQIADLSSRWVGRFDNAGMTVTGLVQEGFWSSLNPETLAVPGRLAWLEAVQGRLRVPVTLLNDAQAAAWGEFCHGAGRGMDIAFLTISTGVGGGIVFNGRLVQGRDGLAGHFGQSLAMPEGPAERFEDGAAGRWIAAQGRALGLGPDAQSVFAAAAAGHDGAEQILQISTRRVARLCHNLQLMFAPEATVIGGGIGLAPGYLDRLIANVETLQPVVRPNFVRAVLGKDAGVIGVADLSRKNPLNREEMK